MVPSQIWESHSFTATFVYLLSLLSLLQLLPATLAGSQNVTVDDADPSISWSLPASQISLWNNQDCGGCTAKPPNLGQVNDGTWHDGTHFNGDSALTASFSFKGTAIYVFGITINSNSANPSIKNQDLSFSIDSQVAGTYTYTPNTPDYHYHVPFFGTNGLSNAEHTIDITVEATSFVLVDYFVVTQFVNDQTEPPSQSTAGGEQVSSAAGGQPVTDGLNSPSQSIGASSSTNTPSSTDRIPSPSSTSPSTPSSHSSSVPIPTSSTTGIHNPTTSTSPSLEQSASKINHSGLIIGIVLGCALLIAGLVIIYMWTSRRRVLTLEKRRSQAPMPFTDPRNLSQGDVKHMPPSPNIDSFGVESIQPPSTSKPVIERKSELDESWRGSTLLLREGSIGGPCEDMSVAAETSVVDPYVKTESRQEPTNRNRRSQKTLHTTTTDVPPAYSPRF